MSGLDPGLKVTATMTGRSVHDCREDVRRYLHQEGFIDEGEQKSVSKLPRSCKVTTGMVRHATHSHQHRKARERHNQGEFSDKKLEKNRRSRELRSKAFYGRLSTSIRKRVKPSALDKSSGAYFVGNWRPINCPIKGSNRGSAKKVYE